MPALRFLVLCGNVGFFKSLYSGEKKGKMLLLGVQIIVGGCEDLNG
jgi:hypothetical protein